MEEILELQLLIRDRAFAIFSTIEKALACHKKSLGGPHVVQACCTPNETINVDHVTAW